MPELIERVKRTRDEESEDVYREVAKFITRTGKNIMDRRPETRSPH